MTARVLVVDDLLPNLKMLEARLTAEYFDVRTATSGPECLAVCAEHVCDIILLDVMMPGMDGFEVCRRLKGNLHTAHIPVVMVTALDQPAERIKGLEAGADDFLTKPVDEIALIARVRSLSRLKLVIDELRTRAMTAANLGIRRRFDELIADTGDRGKVLLVEDRPGSAERIVAALRQSQTVDVEPDAREALNKASDIEYDVIVISLGLENFDPLRLCSQIRALERTRQVPVLIISDLEDRDRVLRAFDLGVNDYIARPIERNELKARLRTQIRRKRYADSLRESLQASIEMAVVDPLTGLHNRRYFEGHLASHLDQSAKRGRPLSLMILDIDHFKRVNDTYGHDVGDEVLKVFALRAKAAVRTADLVCRLGGEEFVIVMPETGIEIARRIAERVRNAIGAVAFPISAGNRSIAVTVSIGLADRGKDTQWEAIFKRADKALYKAKHEGRNRVSADAA